MKIKAIYEDGRLSFSAPLRFKHARVEVEVEIPDVEIESTELDDVSKRLVERLDAIRNAPIPAERSEVPSSKLDRLDAFALFRDA